MSHSKFIFTCKWRSSRYQVHWAQYIIYYKLKLLTWKFDATNWTLNFLGIRPGGFEGGRYGGYNGGGIAFGKKSKYNNRNLILLGNGNNGYGSSGYFKK